jgi:uncharacterized protein YdeI (BOF family)
MLKRVLFGCVVAFALAGCHPPQESVLGVAPASRVTSTVKDLSTAPEMQTVTLRGEMIEKCPVAGCWFMLRDKTGVARVDTKAAGFVVSNVPLHTTLTVSGKPVPGSQPGLAAAGIRY